MRPRRYRVEFVKRDDSARERRQFYVWAYNKLDASVAAMKELDKIEGDDWRRRWWEVGAFRE